MPQPPAYNRDHDFGQDYPDQIDRVAMNSEFDGAASSINAIRENLALIQRDDGGLLDGIVTSDTLAPSLKAELYAEFEGGASAAVAAAQQAAADAKAYATAAEGSAQSALDNSVEAVNTANSASATANAIDGKATQAQTDAAAALAAATSAESKVNMEIAGLPEATQAVAYQEFVINDDGDRRKIALGTIQDYLEEEFEDEFAKKNHTHTAAQITDASAVGCSVLTAPNAAAARDAIGASNLAPYTAGDVFTVGVIGYVTAVGTGAWES